MGAHIVVNPYGLLEIVAFSNAPATGVEMVPGQALICVYNGRSNLHRLQIDRQECAGRAHIDTVHTKITPAIESADEGTAIYPHFNRLLIANGRAATTAQTSRRKLLGWQRAWR